MCHTIYEHDQYVHTIWYLFYSIQYISHNMYRGSYYIHNYAHNTKP